MITAVSAEMRILDRPGPRGIEGKEITGMCPYVRLFGC